MEILYQDNAVIVCVKPAGLDAETDVPAALAAQLGIQPPLCVHRLDKPVGGVTVYAANRAAAAALSAQSAAGEMEKVYLAAACGVMETEQAVWTDLLYHDARKNKSYVVNRLRKGVKEAALDCRRLSALPQTPAGPAVLLALRLRTGRTHQIRIQCASRKLPLAGDVRYGGPGGYDLALWAWRLRFSHPGTGARLTFCCPPPDRAPWSWFEAQVFTPDG